MSLLAAFTCVYCGLFQIYRANRASCLSCISAMLKSTQLNHLKAFYISSVSRGGNSNSHKKSGAAIQTSVFHTSRKVTPEVCDACAHQSQHICDPTNLLSNSYLKKHLCKIYFRTLVLIFKASTGFGVYNIKLRCRQWFHSELIAC